MNEEDIFEYASFKKRLLAAVIDAFFLIVILWPLSTLFSYGAILSKSVIPVVFVEVITIAFFVYMVVRFGVTPGKYIAKLRVVSIYTNEFLKTPNALVRRWDYILGSIQYILTVYTALKVMPTDFQYEFTFFFGDVFFDLAQPSTVLGYYIGAYVWLDLGFILFNRKKRAIHDLIAGSVVITEESYLKVKEMLK